MGQPTTCTKNPTNRRINTTTKSDKESDDENFRQRFRLRKFGDILKNSLQHETRRELQLAYFVRRPQLFYRLFSLTLFCESQTPFCSLLIPLGFPALNLVKILFHAFQLRLCLNNRPLVFRLRRGALGEGDGKEEGEVREGKGREGNARSIPFSLSLLFLLLPLFALLCKYLNQNFLRGSS